MREWALARARELVLARVAGLPVRVWLFGSSATGRWHHASDIDIALEAFGAVPPALLSDIVEDLEESDIPYFVDVVDLTHAAPALAATVRAEGVPWTHP